MSARSIFPIFILSAVVAGSPLTAGACDIHLGELHVLPLTYDPFAFHAQPSQVQVAVTLVGDAPCTALAQLDRDDLTPLDHFSVGGTDGLQFDVRGTGTATGDVPVDLSPQHPTATLQWTIVPTRDAVLPPGSYLFPMAVRIRADGVDAIGRGSLTIAVPARAEVNIAGASGHFGGGHISVVDFGALQSNAQRRVFVQIRANTGVIADIRSRNGGVLVNEQWPTSPPIAYSVSLAGQKLALAAPQTVPVDPPPTIDGVSLPMDIVIGDVQGKLAGRYSDTITIEVSPR